MAFLLTLQIVALLVMVLWVSIAPSRSWAGAALRITASAMGLIALASIGIWLFPPWWTPWFCLLAVTMIGAWHIARDRPITFWPKNRAAWAGSILSTALMILSAVAVWHFIRGTHPPDGPEVALALPFEGGSYLVVNGGNDNWVNAHLGSMTSSDLRFIPWRGNGYAVDLIAIDHWGFRTRGLLPTDPGKYQIYGTPVLAPCAGSVVRTVDGFPDMLVPKIDNVNKAGNYIVLRSGDVQIVLAHLRSGSLRVRVGDTVRTGQLLGEIGNSGKSNEPHLHIHAQGVPVTTNVFESEPLPITLDGHFPVRGDRFTAE